MNNENLLEMIFDTDSCREANELGFCIHEQLKGNMDYINSNIILHIDENIVYLDIDKCCRDIPEIEIEGKFRQKLLIN